MDGPEIAASDSESGRLMSLISKNAKNGASARRYQTSDKVTIRTHKGSGERTITLDHLKQVGHLSQAEAAERLNVGNTRFKMATRQLGMKSWPYRKIKSIRNLIAVVNENPEFFGEESAAIVALLRMQEDIIFRNPGAPLGADFKKFRQAAYKLKHNKMGRTRTDDTEGVNA